MEVLLSTVVVAAIAQNLALNGLLGLCPMVALSRRYDVASGMAIAVMAVLPVLSMLAYLFNRYLLQPRGLEHLSLIVWALLITLSIGVGQILIARYCPRLHEKFASYAPFLGMNCLVLGAVLMTIVQAHSGLQAAAVALGTAVGYAWVLLTVAAIRERLAMTALPAAMRGLPAVVLALAMLTLALQGLRGVSVP